MGHHRIPRSFPFRSVGLLLSLIAVGGLLASCGDDSGTPARRSTTTNPTGEKPVLPANPPLAGTAWLLTNAVEGTTVPTLDFSDDAKVSGSTGCNRFSGKFTQKGAEVQIALGPMTQMAYTSDAATTQEKEIIAALSETRQAAHDTKTLILRDSSGKVLLSYTSVSAQLTGTSWKVLGVNNGKQAVVSSALTEKLTLEFGSDGHVSGNGGCNTFRGSYTQDGDNVKISDLASTMMGCEPDVAELETQYLKALEASTKATRSGNDLELRDDSGAMQVHAQLAA